MGLVGSLIKGLAKSAKHAIDNKGARRDVLHIPSSPQRETRFCEEFPAKHSVVLEGNEERRVYVYDGAPLKGTRKGSVFYVEVARKPVRLVSTLNMTEWDSETDGGVALTINGTPFGMTGTLEKTFRKLIDKGYSISIKAKRKGMYDTGIPEVSLLIPDPQEIFRWLDACDELGEEVPFDERNSPRCEAAAAAHGERKRLEFGLGISLPEGSEGVIFNLDEWAGSGHPQIETSVIPTPKGSQAKPHIVVKDGERKIAEVSARNGQYRVLSEHVGESPFATGVRKMDSMIDAGGHYWRLTIAYAPRESEASGKGMEHE